MHRISSRKICLLIDFPPIKIYIRENMRAPSLLYAYRIITLLLAEMFYILINLKLT